MELQDNTEHNVDEILANLGGDQPGISDTAPEAPAAPQWDGKQFEFDFNGKKVFPDSVDKAKTWMSQGYGYSQRAAEWNRREAEYKQKLQGLDERVNKWQHYNDVDKYVEQNPDWWKHVQESWEKRNEQQQLANPEVQQLLTPYQERLQALESFIQTIQAERAQEINNKHDQALANEVKSVQESYPDIDFSAANEAGETLELQILKHAQEIGTTSFRAAARDYLHDRLVEMAKAKSLEGAAKSQAENAKKGILGVTPTPKKGIQQSQNVRGKSWDDLTKEAFEELGINY